MVGGVYKQKIFVLNSFSVGHIESAADFLETIL